MFVREKSARGHTYLYLVENEREGGRIRQRIIRALGRKDVLRASGELDRLAASLVRHCDRAVIPGFRVVSREFSEEFGGRLVVQASQAGAIVVGDEGVEVGVTFGMVEKAAVVLCQEGARAPCCTRDEGGPFGAVL